ncbi:MAG: thioredoxin family protein [Gammaproteobacteria bacterium]
MVKTTTPICDFDTPAVDFKLPDTAGKLWTLQDCCGPNGLLIMFICNHCPYVQAILDKLVVDTRLLQEIGVHSVAIMSNDILDYQADSPENMKKVALLHQFPFPYLYDESQSVAKAYGAVCTPDFFGYNRDLHLQYRGRFDNREIKSSHTAGSKHELLIAMQQIAETGQGPREQESSIGCSIKWK